MNLAHKSPIVQSIVFNLIREVHYEKFNTSKKYSLDISMIPRLSEDFFIKKGYIPESIDDSKKEIHLLIPKRKNINFAPLQISQQQINLPNQNRYQLNEDNSPPGFKESVIEPTEQKKNLLQNSSIPQQQINLPNQNRYQLNEDNSPLGFKESVIEPTKQKKNLLQNSSIPQQINLPNQNRYQLNQQQRRIHIIPINILSVPPNYGKLNSLIKDFSISMITCDGPRKPLKIIKNGKEQIVQIFLEKQEIMNLLYQISAKTRIPLVWEGVYRVSWDKFIINAVISELTEPNFVIKRI